MRKTRLLGWAVSGAVVIACTSASAATTEKCRARQGVPAAALAQETMPAAGAPGSGSRSPCARPPVAAVLPAETAVVPPPAAPVVAPRSGFFGIPLLASLLGLGAAGALAAGGDNAAAASP